MNRIDAMNWWWRGLKWEARSNAFRARSGEGGCRTRCQVASVESKTYLGGCIKSCKMIDW
jgi:hypothetical protein